MKECTVIFLNGDDEFTPQLVKYKLTSGGKIKMLDTARQGTGSGDDSLELTVNASFMTYIIGGVFGGQYTLNDTSVVFNVPTDVSDEGGYSIGSAGQFQSTKQYTFKGYDGAKDRMIRAMVLDGGEKRLTVIHLFCIKQYQQGSGQIGKYRI